MRRADRLFRIVQLLRRRRFATAEQLADELEVSKRTVYRDIRDLEVSGVPIRGEAGVGYHLDRRFELPPLTFTSEEIEALVLGARVVETWTDRDLARAARSALQKVEAVLPEPLVDVLTNVALYVPNVPRARYMTDGLSDLRKAIVTHHKVRFDYERADGARTTRTVRPLGLYFWGSKWSLAAWCELREDYRNFRPDRMAHLQLTDDPFPTDDGITLEAFLESSRDR